MRASSLQKVVLWQHALKCGNHLVRRALGASGSKTDAVVEALRSLVVSFAEKFREKAEEYKTLGNEAPSLVMRAWYASLHRSYSLLADDEEHHYSHPVLPMVEAAPTQPSDHDLRTLDELEAELVALASQARRDAALAG